MVFDLHIEMITELHMAAIPKSNDWWLDSGATIHVCNNKALFKTYEENNERKEVLIGNHNSIIVLKKATIDLFFTSKQKLTLVNIFHVLEIRKHLVFTSLLSKKGFKIIVESIRLWCQRVKCLLERITSLMVYLISILIK